MGKQMEVWRIKENAGIYVIPADEKENYPLSSAVRLFSFEDDGRFYPSDILTERFHLTELNLIQWPEEISVRNGYSIQVIPNGAKPGDFPYEWRITDPRGEAHNDPTSWNNMQTALEQGIHAVASIDAQYNQQPLTKEQEMIENLQEVVRTLLDLDTIDLEAMSKNPDQRFTLSVKGSHIKEAMEAINQADSFLPQSNSPSL